MTSVRLALPALRCRTARSSPAWLRPCFPVTVAGPSRQHRPEPLLGRSRLVHTTLPRPDQQQQPVEGATEISHSTFISSAKSSSDFNPDQTPDAGTKASSPWQGHLSPTTTHLFKLILPLPTASATFKWHTDPAKMGTKPQPTAFLLHPSQPLSHLSRLIAGSLPVKFRDCEVEYLALTGQEDDLDSHLRNAEEEATGAGAGAGRQEGGPHLGERQRSRGRFQEVSWSQATDLADFVKQSCLNEKFKIVITPKVIQDEADARAGSAMTATGAEDSQQGGDRPGVALEVLIPSFASRTTYLRKRLLELTKSLDTMTKQKKQIDVTAHKGAQRLAVVGLSLGAAYWIAVIRWTFFTDAGWDIMEPVTWATGFGALLASCAFLVYHNREVSYSSLLDLSITARQQRLYDEHGLNIERWTEMVSEAKTLRKEIARIAADYDIEWKGELENLANDSRPLSDRLSLPKSDKSHRDKPVANNSADRSSDSDNNSNEKDDDGKLDIDKTIDEAAELADESEHKRNKEKAAQRKGEVIDDRDDRGVRKEERQASEQAGREKGQKEVSADRQRLE